MQSQVSVIIPTFNSAPFIADTLTSALEQDTPAGEIIVVDDASTDETAKIVQGFTKKASIPIRLIRLAVNSGSPVLPMNIGVQASRFSLFTILDHDDLLEPGAIACYSQAWLRLADPTLGMIASDQKHFRGQSEICFSHLRRPNGVFYHLNGSMPNGEVVFTPEEARRLLCHSSCLPAKAVFSRATWESLSGFSNRYRSAWDEDYVWRVAEKHKIAVVDRILVRVRLHGQNLSGNPSLVCRELINHFYFMLADTRNPELRSVIRKRIEKESFDIAYSAYKGRAFRTLLPAICRLAIARMYTTLGASLSS